jgi:hypothetical protein
MPLVQRKFTSGNYHVANDAPFQDDRLSWEAKGVLGYLFSKPEEWTPRMFDIVESGPCEKYKIRSVFEELENHGYMKREKVRADDGTFNWKVVVADHPRFDPGWSEPTPDTSHHGQDGGSSNTDSKSDGLLENTDNTTTAAERAPAGTREDDPDPFCIKENDVDAITAEAFGTPVQGLSIKDHIEQKCEDNGPEGWDCLRAVCQTIIDKGWNPSAALVKTRLEQQIQMINASHDPQERSEEHDDFAEKAKSIFEAAGRGAGVYE